MADQTATSSLQSSRYAEFDSKTASGALMREPVAEDAPAIADLIGRCPPLDCNSVYATLLLCTHFSETCGAAFRGERIAGWVSAYTPPATPDVLFVWQVAIAPEHRGQGLARRIITDILARPACAGARQIQTTITADNAASWALFRSVADKLRAKLYGEPHFLRGPHFGGGHETEHLVTIGPFKSSAFCGDN